MRENKTALMKATDLLANQEQSSKTLRRKLLARKFEESEVDDAIDKLKKYNYLNDEAACRRQFENFYAEGKLSVRQICVKLIQRGFDSNFVQSLIPDDIDEHEKRAAFLALEKTFRSQKIFDLSDAETKFKFKNKLRTRLASKGFDSEIINFAIENYLRAVGKLEQ